MQFPEAIVETAIRDEIVAAGKDRPPTKSGWRPEVDSQVVIRVVLRVEAEIGIELPEDTMPPGGFDDVEDCVQGILAQSRRLWREKQHQEGETVS
jgi:acyl carrier protein